MIMNGTYYEITCGMEEDIITKNLTDKKAKEIAFDTERIAYRNTYENGIRIDSVKIWDPYNDEYYEVGSETVYYEPLPPEKRFEYSMLARLKADCDYYLGNGNRHEKCLWAGTVGEQITEMRNRWNAFADDEKPEWLTMADIDDYERRMTA